MMRFSPITLGQQVKSVEVEGFVLTETKHPPSFIIPRHAHERTSISFVLKGSFVETFGRNAQECAPFNLLIKPAGAIHEDRYGHLGAETLIIEVKPERLDLIRPLSTVLERAGVVRERAITLLAMNIYREFRAMDTASPLAIEGLVLEMLAEASRQNWHSGQSARLRWLLRAVEIMHDDFAQHLTLSKIALEVGVHPAHLARRFRQSYHSTVGDYLRKLRLEYAARELVSSDRSLAEIAILTGFYDQSHLTHAFRMHMKMTPAAFRKAFKSRKAATKKLQTSKTS